MWSIFACVEQITKCKDVYCKVLFSVRMRKMRRQLSILNSPFKTGFYSHLFMIHKSWLSNRQDNRKEIELITEE